MSKEVSLTDALTLAVAKAIYEAECKADKSRNTWDGLQYRLTRPGDGWARPAYNRATAAAQAAIKAYEDVKGEEIDRNEEEIRDKIEQSRFP